MLLQCHKQMLAAGSRGGWHAAICTRHSKNQHLVSTYRSIGIEFFIVVVCSDGNLREKHRYVGQGGHPLFVLHAVKQQQQQKKKGQKKIQLLAKCRKPACGIRKGAAHKRQSEPICMFTRLRDSFQVLCIFICNDYDKLKLRDVGVTELTRWWSSSV